MDCICLNRRRRKRERHDAKNHKVRGSQNLAYVEDDDDMLQNSAVLAEIGQAEAETRLQEQEGQVEADVKHSTSSAEETNSLRVARNGSSHHFLTPNCYTAHSTQDDLCLNHYNYECVEVDLMSKDTAGPGFSVTGTLTDGIIIGSLHEKGPALQSGKINSGDRILSVTIGFDNMTYEDALTILSYAAPYPMTLKLARGSKPQNHIAAGTSSELTELNARIYHPVYRSQSVDGGIPVTKKQRKIPSRPGTSLSQIDYATHETSNEGSQESLEGSLIKDKFGNTLNLIDASDSTLHVRLSSSDTTVDSSVRSESHHETATMLTETSEEVATAFTVPVQAIACSVEAEYPIVAEVMVTEPPTQIKLATLASVPKPLTTENTQYTQRAATPHQMPPEKPKRMYQFLAEEEVSVQPPEGEKIEAEDKIAITEPQIELPSDVSRPEKISYANMDEGTRNNILLEIPVLEDIEQPDSIDHPSTPVFEPVIEPTCKVNQLESSLNSPAWIDHFEVKSRGRSVEFDQTSSGLPAKPATLTVDTVKIKDDNLEEVSHSRQSSNTLEQPSPNDSGIHSEKSPSEQDVEEMAAHGDREVSSGSSSPHRHRITRSTSDDLLTAVYSLASPPDKKEAGDGSDTPSSQVSTPSAIATRTPTSKFAQPEPVIPKATSRSQLEAARARFFAELMQNSELFKDSPTTSLSFSSDSLNNDATPPNDPFKKYVNRDSAQTTTNNNSLTCVGSVNSSEPVHSYTTTPLTTTEEDHHEQSSA